VKTAPASGTSSRELALSVIHDVFGPEQRSAHAAFDARARKSTLDARDRAFAAELAYGAIKGRRLLDWYLAPYLAGRDKPLPPVIHEILWLGVYQLRMMSGVDAHAAVFETVNLANRHGHRGTAGLVNAVLRRFIADAPAPPHLSDFDRADDYFGTAYSVPTWIAAHFGRIFGDATEEILRGINAAPQHAVRVNRLRSTVADTVAALEASGTHVLPSALVEESLVVITGHVNDDPEGRWAIQSETACVPVDVLAPRPGEIVLDLCSGRGNKSVQSAARMENQGQLIFVEIDMRKAKVLREHLERAGVTAAAVVEGDARNVDLPEADAALIDAPCSGLGILGRHPEARWRKSPDDGSRLAALQAELLDAAAARLKPNGRFVYSVCTSDPREGVDVIEAFLGRTPGFARAPFPERYQPFARGGDLLIPPGIDGRDGFFIAKLVRS
jgi:16S rRNA (cytosine967-C5)-methyltransferase